MPDRLPVDAGGLHDDMRTTFRRKPIGEGYQSLGGCLERLDPCRHLALYQVTNAGHHRLLVNVETGTMQMQKFHRSSSAPPAWNPDRRNLESVLRGGAPPVATIRGAQGAPGPTVTRADAHQSHTDLYAHDAKSIYTNTFARFLYRGSETPVGDCYETRCFHCLREVLVMYLDRPCRRGSGPTNNGRFRYSDLKEADGRLRRMRSGYGN